MSSSNTSYFTALYREFRKTPETAPDAALRIDSKRKRTATRRSVKPWAARHNSARLLRYALYSFLLCCALYTLYKLGLYLLYRDRLFYSLFIARRLML